MTIMQSSVAFVGPEDQLACVISRMAVNAAAATLGGSVDEQAIPDNVVTAELVLRNLYRDHPVQAFEPSSTLPAVDESPDYCVCEADGHSALVLSLTTGDAEDADGNADGNGDLSPLLLAFLDAASVTHVGIGLVSHRDGEETVSLLAVERGDDGTGMSARQEFRREIPVGQLFDFMCDWSAGSDGEVETDSLMGLAGEMALDAFALSYEVIDKILGA